MLAIDGWGETMPLDIVVSGDEGLVTGQNIDSRETSSAAGVALIGR